MLDTLLFDNWDKLIRIFLMSLLTYPFLILLLRITGKRTLAQVNMFDFVITVSFGAAFASILITKTVSFSEGALLLFMLVALQFVVAKLEVHSGSFAKLTKSSPVFLYVNGEFQEEVMKRQRLKKEDLRSAVRKKGMASFEKIEAIVLEGDGTLSVVQKSESGSREALEGIKSDGQS